MISKITEPFCGNLDVVAFHYAPWAVYKSEEHTFAMMEVLQIVKKSRYDGVPSRSLTAGKDNSHP